MKRKWIIVLTFIATLLIAGGITLKYYINSQEIKKLLNDPIKLNKYIAEHQPFVLKDIKIDDHDLNGINLINGKINDTEWVAVNAQKSRIDNIIIKNSTFKNVNFSYSSMNNVAFDHVSFDHAKFNHCMLKNISFIDCKFTTSSFNNLIESELSFEKSDINDNDFYKSQVKINLKETSINDADMSLLKPSSRLVMQDGELKNIRMSKAHLDELNLNGVYMDAVGCPKSIINTIYIKGGKLDIDVPAADIQKFSIYDSNINTLSLGGAKIKDLNISNCKETDQLEFFRGHIDKLTINNCYANGLDLAQVNINELTFSNVSTKESLSEHATINTCRLDNFQMSGEIDLSGSMIKNLYIHDFHYDPNAKVKTDGSNLEYNAHGLKLKGIWPEVTSDKWLIFHWRKGPIN
jgi:uncharacterized protein YjbI with pentapeptide repeats